jgi:[mycofactocin precursor peptide]-tyrosine decarboxylase / 3-amino-5-[(4-hydroxyphenyl)methyl]-4,4-dimethylpyrrolidin-2-one synthase
VLTGDSFFSITSEDRRELGLNMCGAAKMTCSVSPDGTIYPCAFLQDNIFMAGNVTEESFESIWLESQAFNIMRAIRIESCECCSRFNLCHGGCPAVAYFLTKSLDYCDPECMISLQEQMYPKESNKGVFHHVGTV